MRRGTPFLNWIVWGLSYIKTWISEVGLDQALGEVKGGQLGVEYLNSHDVLWFYLITSVK